MRTTAATVCGADDVVGGVEGGGGLGGGFGDEQSEVGAGACAAQSNNVCFSVMTPIATSSHDIVHKPVHIMSIIAWLPISIPANWCATHSGGPMHGAMVSVSDGWFMMHL